MKAAAPAAYNLFAFNKADGSHGDIRRRDVPEWNLHRVVEWALSKQVDTLLIEVADKPASGTPGVVHHLCRDPGCPGGC